MPQAPINIEIALKPGSPTPGKPIDISWQIVNTSAAELVGSLTCYLNQEAISIAGPAIVSVLPGKTLAGTESFDVVPGVYEIDMALVDVHPANATPKPTELENGKAPSPAGKPEAGTPAVNAVALGSLWVNASPPVASISPNGLTAAQRQKLMVDYAPLFLYSFDHGSDEQYAPIDVLSFIKASTLQSSVANVANLPNATLNTTPLAILDPAPSTAPKAGTITSAQPTLPAELYVTPMPNTVQHGAPWADVMSSRNPNVGLYGHVTLLDLEHFQSDADPTLPQRFAARYGCAVGAACPAQIIKIEYWQFFGYSHDYQGLLDGSIDPDTDHTGDWCTVQVYVDASWWLSPQPDKAILAVYHYLHGIQVGFDMAQAGAPAKLTVPARAAADKGSTYSAQEFHGPNHGKQVQFPIEHFGISFPVAPDKATEEANAQNNILQLAAQTLPGASVSYQHPVVYAEWGGHEFWPSPGWSYEGASKHNGTGQYSYFGSSPTDLTIDITVDLDRFDPMASVGGHPDVALVTTFAGYWGEKGGGGPPQGPPLHTQWYWNPKTTNADLLEKIDPTGTTPKTVQRTF